ncbi:MAG TPA: glycosyltransferase [Clostridia bacterium]|nr:glycosyltransferase [Clostridia bacterium]
MIEQLKHREILVPDCPTGNVPVVMTSSASYLPYTCVALHSLLRHANPARFYDILLLHQQDYPPAGLDMLSRIVAAGGNCRVRLVDVRGQLPEGAVAAGHVSVETYARLLLPRLLPAYDHVVYLDGDLVVCRDVAELLDTPCPPDAMLSGVPDLDVIGQYHEPKRSMRYYLDKKLGLPAPDRYLQAGVLVFHLNAIRAALGENALLRAGTGCRLRYFDQDVLNCLCNEHVHLLDLRWNVVSDCDGYRVSHIISHAPAPLYVAYCRSRQQPWIVHYSGRQKPWNDPRADMGDYFARAVADADLGELLAPPNVPVPSAPLYKRVAAWLLPPQSQRRELCKTLYFHYQYRSVDR